jgi:hypothetical protein
MLSWQSDKADTAASCSSCCALRCVSFLQMPADAHVLDVVFADV